jgi:Ca2+:H+ antiporter
MTAIWRSLPFPKYLLPVAPLALVLHFINVGGALSHFLLSAVGILGLVVVIGAATEEVAVRVGPVWGGLLNATFGNVTELIIALIALSHGSYAVLRASLTGSILGNLLLLLGMAMVAGGIKYKSQKFSRTGAAASVQMLALALFALVIPSVTYHFRGVMELDKEAVGPVVEKLSLGIAIILLIVYALHLVFSLWTHSFTYRSDEAALHEEPKWSLSTAVVILVISVVLVALCSEAFVGSLDHMIKDGSMPISEVFLGVVVVAVVGNAAEGSVAVVAAAKNKMELAFQVAMSSAIQIALLVAPILVVASFIFAATPLTLVFSPLELLALWGAVLIAGFTLQDGESNWFEGAMLLAVYAAFALAFWFHP